VMGEASLAFADAGLGLRVKDAGKVRVTFATPGQARIRIVVEPGATLDYAEIAEGDGFQNIGTEIVLSRGARMTHARLARAGTGVRIADVSATVAEGGSYCLYTANCGSALSRLELDIALDGAGAEAHLFGVSELDGTH